MGESNTRVITVYMPAIAEEAEDLEAEVIEEYPKTDSFREEDAQETNSRTVAPMQHINNPFTFIQNGNNNVQIGYITNQTNIKK